MSKKKTGDLRLYRLQFRLRRSARFLIFGLLAVGGGAAWQWHSVLEPIAISATINRYPAAPLWFTAAHIAASLLCIPRTLLAIVAGLSFGMVWGIFWAALGSVAGAIAGFLVARCLTSGLINLKPSTRAGPILDQVHRGGWRAVALLRLIPVVPHSMANYALGLTRLRVGEYAVGSLIGQLPMTIAYVDLGAAGDRLMLGGAGWLEPTLLGIAALGVSMLVPAIVRRKEAGSARLRLSNPCRFWRRAAGGPV